jgi:hypothetical protein
MHNSTELNAASRTLRDEDRRRVILELTDVCKAVHGDTTVMKIKHSSILTIFITEDSLLSYCEVI